MNRAPIDTGPSYQRYLGDPAFFILLTVFAIVTIFINPVREMPTGDDWAYALTVRHLLETGEYRLHDWSAANMPTQIYWGSLFAKLFGFSFSTLRSSTLVLSLIGLSSLYFLLRDVGVKSLEACILTVVVISCPLMLLLAFTFQTDVQLVAWIMLALCLYTRALQRRSYRLIVLGSIAAAAAIGTRQFGISLVAGLLGTWLFVESSRLKNIGLYIVGLFLPLLITFWQILAGVSEPTFTQTVRLGEQLAYLKHWSDFLIQFILWRPTVILQYLGLFLLPLVPILLFIIREHSPITYLREGRRPVVTQPWALVTFCAVAIYMLLGVFYGYFIFLRGLLMPSLSWIFPWSLPFYPFGFKKHVALTAAACVFGTVLAWTLLLWFFTYQRIRMSTRGCMITITGFASVVLQLMYAQFHDTYLIQFIPFFVIYIGVLVSSWEFWCKLSAILICSSVLIASSLWVRSSLEQAEAMWTAAETLRSAGASIADVGGNMTWSCYKGAFDSWITDVGGAKAAKTYVGDNRMHFLFFKTLQQQYAHAEFLISGAGVNPLSGSFGTQTERRELYHLVEYRDFWLRKRAIVIYRRFKENR